MSDRAVGFEEIAVLARPSVNDAVNRRYGNTRIPTRNVTRFALGTLLVLCATAGGLQAAQPAMTTKEVGFRSAGIALSATTYVPHRPLAAVVLVDGSGQVTRKFDFAQLLANNDIAVLTYDKRGVGVSQGTYAGPEVGTNNVSPGNPALLARDASAAVNELRRRMPRNHSAVRLLGFSQAGWVIPLAARRNPAVKFMVLLSGPIVTTREQLRFQFTDTDPRLTLARLSIRGLWVFSGKDVQLPVRLSIENLEALKARGKPYEYPFFQDADHGLGDEPALAAIESIRTLASREH
jgi:uncharacterized protein